MIADSVNDIVKQIEQVNSSILKLEEGNMIINDSFRSLASTSDATTATTTTWRQKNRVPAPSRSSPQFPIFNDSATELYESVRLF